MGIYVNPPNESKEMFLRRQTVIETLNPAKIWAECPKDHLPVVWMDNGPFTAAGVCYSKSECFAFLDPRDYRPKKAFYVSIDQLLEVSDLQREYIEP